MNNNTENREIKINLLHLIKVLWRKAWVIVLSMAVCGVLAFSYAAFIAVPIYESRAVMYVNNSAYSNGLSESASIGTGELTAARSLVDTYVLILTSRTTMEAVIEKAGLDCTYKELTKMIRAGSVDSTELFEIVASSDDPAEAELIVDTITEILPERIAEIVDGSSVRIVDDAELPDEKSFPNDKVFTAAGLFVGFAVSCAVILVSDLLKNTVDD